jgi:hypothetical protein
MNGWTAVVVVADILGVAAAIVLLRRRRGDDPMLRMLIVGVLASGLLIADVAWHIRHLGAVLGSVLLLFSLGPALVMRFSMRLLAQAKGHHARRGAVFPVAISAVAVLAAVSLWGSPKQLSVEERDAARFGTEVQHHIDPSAVKARFLEQTPTLADAGPDGLDGIAVPIEQYALTGRVLTLLAAHFGVCQPTVVLLGPALGGLGVIVVVAPATDPSVGPLTRTAYCRTDSANGSTVHTAIDVDLPAWLNPSGVRDVGGGGAAVRVTADQ